MEKLYYITDRHGNSGWVFRTFEMDKALHHVSYGRRELGYRISTILWGIPYLSLWVEHGYTEEEHLRMRFTDV